ncbi:MAG: tetratricopeptide repeat protein [Deltaproteobacteria bacterium]|nr:tetratricopeptide repeat protein [Deltaproteobacteria bacterium]
MVNLAKILLFGMLSVGPWSQVWARDSVEVIGEKRGREQTEPTGALGWFKAGIKLAQTGEYPAALSRFERARGMSPHWALPHLEIALVHLMTDNDRSAIAQSLSKAVKFGAEMPRAHYLYGVFLQEEGQRKQATHHLVQALKLRPSMVDARYRLATLYVEQGRQAEGIKQFEYVLSQRPSHMGAHRNLAMLFEQSGQLELAEKHLKTISGLFPKNTYHLTGLGYFYRRVGWEKKAVKTFRRAERMDSRNKKKKMRPLLKSRR